MLNKERGITLVALVVTVVVLIILAGVSLSLVISNRSVITKGQEGAKNYTIAQNTETDHLKNADSFTNDIIKNITQ